MAMIGVPSAGGWPRHFHTLCFRIWDNERNLLDWLHEVAHAEGHPSRIGVAAGGLAER